MPLVSELYYTLAVNLPKNRPSQDKIDNLIAVLSSMNAFELEAIVLLITEHAYVEGYKLDISNPIIPYKGSQVDDNVQFNINDLPSALLHVLVKFADVRSR